MIAKKSEKKQIIETKQKEVKETKTEEKKLRNIYLMDYTITDLTTKKIIETNLPDKAKQEYNVVLHKGPKPVFDGMQSIFPKVEEAVKNIKENEEKTVVLGPEEAYGKRDKEKMRVVSMNTFKQNQIRPFVGLTIQADNNMIGSVRSVSGGRVLVDFNSPYADHQIEVHMKKLTAPKDKEKAEIVLNTFFGKMEPKITEYTKDKIKISIKAQQEIKPEIYKQIFEGTLKEFVEVKEIKIETE